MGAIFTFLAAISMPLVWIILRGIGIGVISYLGLDYISTFLGDSIQANFDGMPAAMFAMLSLLGIPKCINIILSAFAVILTIRGVVDVTGSVSSLTYKGNS